MPVLHVCVGVGVCTILAHTVAKYLRANFWELFMQFYYVLPVFTCFWTH